MQTIQLLAQDFKAHCQLCWKVKELEIQFNCPGLLSGKPGDPLEGYHLRILEFLRKLKISSNVSNVASYLSLPYDLVELDLTGNKLSSFPHTLCFLQRLEILDISNNTMSKVSWKIHQLRSLRSLNLSRNSFQEFPQEICSLASLEVLDISHNPLSSISNAIGSLSGLKKIILNNTSVSSLPKTLALLPKLSELEFANTPLAQQIPSGCLRSPQEIQGLLSRIPGDPRTLLAQSGNFNHPAISMSAAHSASLDNGVATPASKTTSTTTTSATNVSTPTTNPAPTSPGAASFKPAAKPAAAASPTAAKPAVDPKAAELQKQREEQARRKREEEEQKRIAEEKRKAEELKKRQEQEAEYNRLVAQAKKLEEEEKAKRMMEELAATERKKSSAKYRGNSPVVLPSVYDSLLDWISWDSNLVIDHAVPFQDSWANMSEVIRPYTRFLSRKFCNSPIYFEFEVQSFHERAEMMIGFVADCLGEDEVPAHYFYGATDSLVFSHDGKVMSKFGARVSCEEGYPSHVKFMNKPWGIGIGPNGEVIMSVAGRQIPNAKLPVSDNPNAKWRMVLFALFGVKIKFNFGSEPFAYTPPFGMYLLDGTTRPWRDPQTGQTSNPLSPEQKKQVQEAIELKKQEEEAKLKLVEEEKVSLEVKLDSNKAAICVAKANDSWTSYVSMADDRNVACKFPYVESYLDIEESARPFIRLYSIKQRMAPVYMEIEILDFPETSDIMFGFQTPCPDDKLPLWPLHDQNTFVYAKSGFMSNFASPLTLTDVPKIKEGSTYGIGIAPSGKIFLSCDGKIVQHPRFPTVNQPLAQWRAVFYLLFGQRFSVNCGEEPFYVALDHETNLLVGGKLIKGQQRAPRAAVAGGGAPIKVASGPKSTAKPAIRLADAYQGFSYYVTLESGLLLRHTFEYQDSWKDLPDYGQPYTRFIGLKPGAPGPVYQEFTIVSLVKSSNVMVGFSCNCGEDKLPNYPTYDQNMIVYGMDGFLCKLEDYFVADKVPKFEVGRTYGIGISPNGKVFISANGDLIQRPDFPVANVPGGIWRVVIFILGETKIKFNLGEEAFVCNLPFKSSILY